MAFYTDVLALPILNVVNDEHSKLTVLGFGADTYLMIETYGKAVPTGENIRQNPVWLRFDAMSVTDAALELSSRGIDVNIGKEAWGTVGEFPDPDGNVCSFREEPTDKLSS